MAAIASYTGRGSASVGRDLDRWEERGFEGLADGTAPGNPPRVTGEVRAFVESRLSEQRTWNATQLAEEIEGRFGIVVTPEVVRQHLVSMGYSWKRTRYVPSSEAAAPRGGARSPRGAGGSKKAPLCQAATVILSSRSERNCL